MQLLSQGKNRSQSFSFSISLSPLPSFLPPLLLPPLLFCETADNNLILIEQRYQLYSSRRWHFTTDTVPIWQPDPSTGLSGMEPSGAWLMPLPEVSNRERRVLHSNQDSALIQIQNTVLFFKDLQEENTSTWTHTHSHARPEFRELVFVWGHKSLPWQNRVSPNLWKDSYKQCFPRWAARTIRVI